MAERTHASVRESAGRPLLHDYRTSRSGEPSRTASVRGERGRGGDEKTGRFPRRFLLRSDVRSEPLAHRERPFDDFAREPLLSVRLSQLGPGLAVGDVNRRRARRPIPGRRVRQCGHVESSTRASGKWSLLQDLFPPWSEDLNVEDMGTLLFDADGDNDLDLLLVSGGVECEPNDQSLRDRLFLNDGKGTFTRAAATDMLPDLRDSGSVAAAADYDRDGDLDLFIGSRSIPGRLSGNAGESVAGKRPRHVSRRNDEHAPELPANRAGDERPVVRCQRRRLDRSARDARMGPDQAVRQSSTGRLHDATQSAGTRQHARLVERHRRPRPRRRR